MHHGGLLRLTCVVQLCLFPEVSERHVQADVVLQRMAVGSFYPHRVTTYVRQCHSHKSTVLFPLDENGHMPAIDEVSGAQRGIGA